jgi:hypothetical protein
MSDSNVPSKTIKKRLRSVDGDLLPVDLVDMNEFLTQMNDYSCYSFRSHVIDVSMYVKEFLNHKNHCGM